MEKWIPLYQAAPLLGYAYVTLFRWIRRSENDPEFYPPELRARCGYHYKYDPTRPRYVRVMLLNMLVNTPRFIERLRQYGVSRRGGVPSAEAIDLLNYVPPPQEEKMIYCPHAAVIMPYSRCLKCWVFTDFDFKPAEGEKPDGFTIEHCIKGHTAETYPREEILCRL